jgi:type I restriction enzyme S subunit
MENSNLAEEWKKVKLSDLGKILTGNTPPTKCEEYYNSNDVMFIKPDDLKENTLNKINNSKAYISLSGVKKARKVPAGSILVTCIGIIGKVAVVEDETCFNQQINAIIPDTSKVEGKFLGYAILKYNYLLRAVANAPIVPIINKTQFSDIEIMIPPLETQKKIVEVLEKAEKALEKRKEANRLLDEYLKSVFVEMFGDPIKNEKEWDKIKLKDVVAKIESGWSPKAQNEPAIDGWGVLKLSAVTGGSYNEHKNKAFLEGVEPKEDLEVKVGDLLFTRKNTRELVGDSAYVFETNSKLMLPDTIFRFVTKDNINKIFLWTLFSNKNFRPQITALANGSAGSMPNIAKSNLMELEIICPSIEHQNQFANIINKINIIKNKNTESRLQIETLFNSLMQGAFNGKLDL